MTCHDGTVTRSHSVDAGRSGRGAPYAGLISSGLAFAVLLMAATVVAALIGTGLTQVSAVPELARPPAVVRFGIPAARALLDLGAVATVGAGLLARLLGFDDSAATEPVMRRVRPLAVWASAWWAVAAASSIVLLTWEISATSGDGFPSPGQIWSYVSNIPAGKGLLLSAGCAVLSWWLTAASVRHGEKVPAELRVGVALFGLLPLPLTGHASNWYWHDAAMVSMEMHVVAATTWAGGLLAVLVFLARRPDLLALTLPRFSRLATWCVLVVGLTGLFNGLVELALSPITTLPMSLWETRYGVLILGKLVCMAAVAGLAVVVRTRLIPRIAAGRPTSVAIWCGWELLMLALAFGIAVVLTRASVTPF